MGYAQKKISRGRGAPTTPQMVHRRAYRVYPKREDKALKVSCAATTNSKSSTTRTIERAKFASALCLFLYLL